MFGSKIGYYYVERMPGKNCFRIIGLTTCNPNVRNNFKQFDSYEEAVEFMSDTSPNMQLSNQSDVWKYQKFATLASSHCIPQSSHCIPLHPTIIPLHPTIIPQSSHCIPQSSHNHPTTSHNHPTT